MENTDLAFSSHSDFVSDRVKPSVITKEDHVNLTEIGGLRGARIASVLAQISESFADQQFSTRVVAEKLGLSVRYVQDLLQGSGLSITDRIMELRLEKARALLTGDRQCSLKISDVAASCGFNELSYFHRSFRRRFGSSPAKFRIQSMNG
jgi:AraC-like DNA-binding protein